MDIFILAGQSNMAGRGGVGRDSSGKICWDGCIPAEYDASLGERVFAYTKSRGWGLAEEPLHAEVDRMKPCGIGPGSIFAQQLLRMGGSASIGLIPCAVGGTMISEWQEGEELFEQMVELTESALRAAPSGFLRAVLWYQGESDCVVLELANSWSAKFAQMLSALRKRLVKSHCKAADPLPVLMVAVTCKILPSEIIEYLKIVRQSQLQLDLTAVYKVDAEGLELQGDGVHLTTAAQVKLGKHLANLWGSIAST